MPPRMRRPRTNGRKKARKPYKKRKAPRKLPRLATFNKMLSKASEKKRFYISPIALTNGDITTSAPLQTAYLQNYFTSFSEAPIRVAQQYCASLSGSYTAGGWSCWDATPYPSQGNGYNQRQGSNIKLVSSYLKFQLSQQSTNTLTPIKIKFFLLQIPGQPLGPGNFVTSMFLNSTFPNGTNINGNDGLIDYNSGLDPDHRRDFKIIAKKTMTLPLDNINAQVTVKEYGFGIKYNRGAGHTVRYDRNSNSPTDGQLLAVVIADAGNAGSYTYAGNGTGTLVNNSSASGALLNFQFCHYYIDP